MATVFFILYHRILRLFVNILILSAVMSEKVCKILLVLSLMLGFPKHGGNL